MTPAFIWQPAGADHYVLLAHDGARLGVVQPDGIYTYAVATLPHGMTACAGAHSIDDGKFWLEMFWLDLAALTRRALPEPTVTAMEGLR